MSVLFVRRPAPPQTDRWPIHSPPYLSVLPGVAGPGMDTPAGTGRHLETPQTQVLFIDSLVDDATAGAPWPEMGEDIYRGSAEYCFRSFRNGMDQNIPTVIVPLISGWVVARKNIPLQQGTPPRPGYVMVAGQFAPHPGLFFRGSRLHFNGASNVVMTHVRVGMGDDLAGLSVENRDCVGSGYEGGETTNIVLANCDLFWGVDETIDMYRKHSNVVLMSCAIINPLHETALNPSEDHGYGGYVGGAPNGQAGLFASFRCLYANSTDRNPGTNSIGVTHANNLHFNHGRPGGGAGFALRIVGQNADDPVLANALWNGFVRGPENNNSIVAVSTVSVMPDDSRVYLDGNAVHGWTATGQAQMLTSVVPGIQASSMIESAYPADWGPDGVLRWHADPNTATQQEWLDYIDLMGRTVGAQPGWRMPQFGKVGDVLQSIRDTINGNMPGPQFSDSVADEGGWFEVPEVGPIDPIDPGQHWHAPFPTTGRDDVLDGSATWGSEPWIPAPFRGTGLQLAGRTVLERFIVKQNWYTIDASTRPPLPPSGDWADVFVDADGVQSALATNGAIVGVRGDTLSDFNPDISPGNGATLTFISAGSFDGLEPAIELRPPTSLVGENADDAHILSTMLARGGAADIAQMNFRWLARYGATYHTLAPNAKVVGFQVGPNRGGDPLADRAAVFDNKLGGAKVFAVTANTVQQYYNPPSGYHPGDGPVANLLCELLASANHAASPPEVGGGEWLCFEFVMDARQDRGNANGMAKLVMTARDGLTRTLQIALTHDAGWTFSNRYILAFEGLGFFFNTAGTAHADNWVRWSHCAFASNLASNGLIGPPPGFLT